VTGAGAPLLSVCIPTHHGRAGTLRQTLESLAGQLGEGAEVCVSDNASADGTEAMVRDFARRTGGRVAYRRHPESLGFTGNLLSAVELARGEFCWLFSSDDVAAPGAIAALTDLLRRHPDLSGATLRPTFRDAGLRADVKQWPRGSLPDGDGSEHVYDTPAGAQAQCGFLAGVLPAQVVRRELWLETAAAEAASGGLAAAGYFPHMRVILGMMRRRPRWAWHPGVLLYMRTGADNSVLDDLRGDVTEYNLATAEEQERLWREFAGGRTAAYRRPMTRLYEFAFNPHVVGTYKLVPAHGWATERRLVSGSVRLFWWWPEFWLKTMPVVLTPFPLVRRAWRLAARRTLRTGARA